MVRAMKEVTDPSILAQLNAPSSGKEVTDPALLSQLNAAPASPLDRLPPDVSPGNQQPKNADDIAHRILGLGEAGLSAATGAVGGAAGQLYGIGKTLASGKFGTQQGVQQGEQAGVNLANKLTYQPRTQTGQGLTEDVGKAFETSRLQGLPVEAGTLGRIGEVPRGALATGEGIADVAGKAGQAAGKVAAKALPEVDPETATLARAAHSMGIRLTPDQVVGGKYSKIAGEGLSSVPLSGSNEAANNAAFLQNLSKQAGVNGPKPTPKAFGEATERVGSGIGDLNEKYDLPLDRRTISSLKLGERRNSPETVGAVNGIVKRIQQKVEGDNLNGTDFRKINTLMNDKIKATSNADTKYALQRLQNKLLNIQAEQMLPPDKAQLQVLRRQYAIQRTIEPLVAKSLTGDIAPSALLGAINATKAGKAAMARGKAGEFGQLAAIGNRFLKEPKSSGTAERRLIQGVPPALASALGAGAGVAGGASALPAILGGIGATYGAANLYNRAGPALTNALISRPPQ
jgi:hypothetical protein